MLQSVLLGFLKKSKHAVNYNCKFRVVSALIRKLKIIVISLVDGFFVDRRSWEKLPLTRATPMGLFFHGAIFFSRPICLRGDFASVYL